MGDDKLDLDGYFPYFLGTISNRWTTTSSKLYLQEFGIGIGEWRVLASIHSLGQASSNEIVNLISMDAGAVSRSVAKLQSEGLIRPVAGKFSGRTKPYELAAQGIKLYGKVWRVALAREDALLGGLNAQERRLLLKLMRKIIARLDQL